MSTSVRRMLIFIPTYNERGNVNQMCEQLLALGLDTDILFMDDNSPDGTGAVLDEFAKEHSSISVLHRSGKLGIGSAHFDGITWAYDHNYDTLVTLDCDFAHSPADIPRLLNHPGNCDVTVGSRYMQDNSLPGWHPTRWFLTNFGHFLTKRFLGVPYDATGALRVYRLDRIPRGIFSLVRARGYGFFFESMCVLVRNGISVGEVPIIMPVRTYGHSKMTAREVVRSGARFLSLWLASLLHPRRFRVRSGA
jgi:dolichol-phosphate mannosyltransferase